VDPTIIRWTAKLSTRSVDNDGDSQEDLTFQFRFQDVQPAGSAVKLNVNGTEISSV